MRVKFEGIESLSFGGSSFEDLPGRRDQSLCAAEMVFIESVISSNDFEELAEKTKPTICSFRIVV